MKLLTFFLLSLFSAVLSAQTVGQYELRKRTSTGFTPYGVTLTDGQVIGQAGGIPAAITLGGSGGAAWGDITGTLSAQTDLQNALNAKLSTTTAAATYAPISHTQAWSTITSTPTTLAGYGITDGITAAAVASGYLALSGGTLTGPLSVYSDGLPGITVGGGGGELILDANDGMPSLIWRWRQEDEENILNVHREMRIRPSSTQPEDMYLELPGIAGTAGQVLAINHVSDATIFTEWSSVAAPPASLIEIGVACSDETTPLTTGTAKVTFRVPRAMTLTAVRASVTTAPTGSILIVDINVNGASILTPLLSIDAGEKTSGTALSQASILVLAAAIDDDDEITIDIDQVGSTVAGAGLKVWLIGTRTAP